MQKAFVTGGSGFVGRNLIEAIKTQGIAVNALARTDKAAAAVESVGALAIQGDLDNAQALERGMAGCDTVFHAAAKVELWGDPAAFHRINVEGTRRVIDAAKKAGVKRLVHVSTEALLAGGKPIVDADESWPYPEKPAGLYPLTKGLAEKAVLEANGNGLETVAIRPPLIWGRGDTSVLPQLLAAVKSGQWKWIDGGHYPHTTTHVRNVVEGLLLAAEKGRPGEVYFISDPETQDFRTFMEAQFATQGVKDNSGNVPYWAANLLASTTEPTWSILGLKSSPPLPRTVLYVMGQKLTVKIDKAKRELGYEGKVTFEEGIKEMNGPTE